MKSKIENVIRDLLDKRIIDLNEPDINMLKGTTEGIVYTLAENTVPKYVIKYNRPRRKLNTWNGFFRAAGMSASCLNGSIQILKKSLSSTLL
ncbi:hypothetical protein V4V35_11375 [Bacillus infantis]|uniref:hypothetical protein n=1 Tax=Bacillus infantis TaxID=324767 RepID=UPI002FBE557E